MRKEQIFTGLDRRIYEHWKQFRPRYVALLKTNGTLEQTVSAAAEWHAQTFSELRRDGVGAHEADELAREPWITPEK